MGKSTINHHFQQLFVCLPKGRLGGSATASRGAREGTHDATQHVLRHHTGPQVEPDQCRDGGGKDEWKWVAFLRIHKWLVTFGEKKHEKKRVLQIWCVWPKLAPNSIWDSRLLAKGAITHNPRSQSERAFKKGYYMFLRTCDIPSRNINCWVENHHLTNISSQFSPRQHWEMCLQLGYTPQDHTFQTLLPNVYILIN